MHSPNRESHHRRPAAARRIPAVLRTAGLVLVIALMTWTGLKAQQAYAPDAVAQRSLDVRSALSVLTVALQPGFEDFEALAYLRNVRGARLASLYVTNGESGSSDDGRTIPGEIAFHRRAEAYEAMKRADGFELFLNMPDFGSASDSEQVRTWWPADTLQERLAEMIQNVRPDLIVLVADLESRGEPSPRWRVLKDDLLAALRLAAVQRRGAGAAPAWDVSMALADDGDGQGLAFPLAGLAAKAREACTTRAASIAGTYSSLRLQLPLWWKERKARYDVLKSAPGRRARFADDGVPEKTPARLAWVAGELNKLNQSLQKKTASGASASKPLTGELKWLVAIMDSVDIIIGRQGSLSNRERKILLHWKEGLEELRNAIYGVDVAYRFQDSVLLAMQVTTVTVDSVKGIPPGGTTELFFPDVGRRWIAGRGTEQRQELALGKAYQLISPQSVELDLPATYGGRDRIAHGTPFPFFVFHTGASRSENFFKKIMVRHLYGPKLTVEPLTPIVRIVPGEHVVVRLTNHSHDGLRDAFGVRDSLASSPRDTIRVSGKEAVLIDTLALTWSESIEDGDYRVPLSIGQREVAYFAARKFDAAVAGDPRVAIAASFGDSPVVQTLRRLGIQSHVLSGEWGLGDLEGIGVLVLDERVMSLHSDIASRKEAIERFAASGGRVIILGQDPQTWNDRPLVAGVRLAETTVLDAASPVVLDSTQAVARSPHLIAPEDWEGWLFARARARAEISDPSMSILATDGARGTALITRSARGSGEIVFVNLSLASQLMNVHPGATRLLANLLSAR